MQVTVDARMFRHSGIGTHLQQVLPRIAAGHRDIDLTLLTDPELLAGCEWVAAPNVRVVPCHAPIYSVSEQRELLRAIPPGSDLYWSPFYVFPVGHRGRVMVTVQDVTHLALPDLFGGLAKKLFARSMFAMVRRRADRVVFSSRFTRSEFLRLVGDPRGTVSLIPHGIDLSWASALPSDTERGRPYFVYVGNVKPHKNLKALLHAFGHVHRDLPHDLLIVGRRDGFITGDDEVSRLASNMEGRVRFTGYVDDRTLRQLVAGAAALVFPSLYEGFGLPPLEAMAAGCPVLVARAASLPEVCGDQARYFDPTDPAALARELVRVVEDPPTERQLDEARRHALRFDWDSAAEETARVIRQTVA